VGRLEKEGRRGGRGGATGKVGLGYLSLRCFLLYFF